MNAKVVASREWRFARTQPIAKGAVHNLMNCVYLCFYLISFKAEIRFGCQCVGWSALSETGGIARDCRLRGSVWSSGSCIGFMHLPCGYGCHGDGSTCFHLE